MATTVRVPVSIRNARLSSLQGNSFFTVLGLTAHDLGHWAFKPGVDGRVYGVVAIPKNVAGTPNAKVVLAFAAQATGGTVRTQVSTKSVAVGVSVNPATLTAETAINTAVPATALNRFSVTYPAAGALAEAVAADSLLVVEIARVGSNVADTMTQNLLLVLAQLEIDLA